jgi:hypothetical protein
MIMISPVTIDLAGRLFPAEEKLPTWYSRIEMSAMATVAGGMGGRHLGVRRLSVIGPVRAGSSAAWAPDFRGLRCSPASRDSITPATATTRFADFEDSSCSGSANPVTMAPLEPASRPGLCQTRPSPRAGSTTRSEGSFLFRRRGAILAN